MQRDHALKKVNFDLLTSFSRVMGEGAAGKIIATMLLHSLFPLILYTTWPYPENGALTVTPSPGLGDEGL